MSPEYYRHRAEECCRDAVTAEKIDRRTSRWLELRRVGSHAREEDVLPPRQSCEDDARDSATGGEDLQFELCHAYNGHAPKLHAPAPSGPPSLLLTGSMW